MPLDSIVVTALQKEMKAPLTGARIDRVSMPEKDMLILSVHTGEGNQKLLISARPGCARMHFTRMTLENPPQPPAFCMLLRKHLTGARIVSLEQPRMERMLLLHVDVRDELDVVSRRTLAVEMMGKGINVVLIGADGRILDCLRRVDYESGARRAVMPGLFYELPPPQDKPFFFSLLQEERERLLQIAPQERDPADWLLDTFGGLSPLLCRELAVDGWTGLKDAMEALCRRVREKNFTPLLFKREGRGPEFSFMPLRQYGPVETEEFPTFSLLLDEFYARRDKAESLRRRSAELTRTIRTARDRQVRKLAARRQELHATEDRELYRRRGDLITANIYRLHRGLDRFEAENYYEADCPKVTIPLDPRKTPQQNAAANYKKYTKAKTAAGVLTGLIAEGEEELSYLESVLDELERAGGDRDLSDIRQELTDGGYLRAKTGGKRSRAPAPRRPLRFVSDSGREILVGRGNVQNDELTFRLARRTDLWLHVQKIPGSHVIVSQSDGPADEETIRQAASLAAYYSKAENADKTAVDYTMVRNVKKPRGAKPGRVIYTEYETLIASGDEALAKRLQADG